MPCLLPKSFERGGLQWAKRCWMARGSSTSIAKSCAAPFGRSFQISTPSKSIASCAGGSRLRGELTRQASIAMLRPRMNSLEATSAVLDALEALQVDYLLVGAFSANAYGIASSTKDADFVVELQGDQLRELMR